MYFSSIFWLPFLKKFLTYFSQRWNKDPQRDDKWNFNTFKIHVKNMILVFFMHMRRCVMTEIMSFLNRILWLEILFIAYLKLFYGYICTEIIFYGYFGVRGNWCSIPLNIDGFRTFFWSNFNCLCRPRLVKCISNV